MNPKTVLITGASSGIGKACAINLASQGCKIIITARRKEKLKALKDQLQEKGVEVFDAVVDVRNRNEVEAFVDSLPESFRKVDVLINNAGLAAGLDPIQLGNVDHWDRMIDTNVKGLLYTTKAVLPLMKDAISPQVINIGSTAGKEVYPSGNVYCGTKHAVDAITRAIRIDLLPLNIRVSSVSPGLVETEFSIVRFDGDKERAAKVYDGFMPLMADDIADAVSYIVNAPSHVTIADIVIMPSAQASSRDVARNT